MKELSIFIDESGDFGDYEQHSPYYIVSMVFHDQSQSIQEDIKKLDRELNYLGMADHCIHTGPIIRKEENYNNLTLRERRRVFNKLVAFFRHIDVSYKCFFIEKAKTEDVVHASGVLAKEIAGFLRDNYDIFTAFDCVKIYYDNGQIELTKILSSVFNAVLPNIVLKKVYPTDYKLFQVADMICTFKLISLKLEQGGLSKSESLFFGNIRDLKKNYLKHIMDKRY